MARNIGPKGRKAAETVQVSDGPSNVHLVGGRSKDIGKRSRGQRKRSWPCGRTQAEQDGATARRYALEAAGECKSLAWPLLALAAFYSRRATVSGGRS